MFLKQHLLYAYNYIHKIIYQFTLHPLGYGTQISTKKTKQAIWSLKAFQVPWCFTSLLMNISTAQQLTLLVSSLSSSLSSCSACYWCLHQPVRKDAPAAVACPSRACRFHGSPSGSTTGRLCARTPTTCFLPLSLFFKKSFLWFAALKQKSNLLPPNGGKERHKLLHDIFCWWEAFFIFRSNASLMLGSF